MDDSTANTIYNNVLIENVQRLNEVLNNISSEAFDFYIVSQRKINGYYDLDTDPSPDQLTYFQTLVQELQNLDSIYVYISSFIDKVSFGKANPIDVDLDFLDLQVQKIVKLSILDEFDLQDAFTQLLIEIIQLGNILADIGENLKFCRVVYQNIADKGFLDSHLSWFYGR